MNIGMLWFDNNKNTPLPTKIERAAQYYQKKYGQSPDLCYLNPEMLNNGSGDELEKEAGGQEEHWQVGEIEVRQTGLVLPNHFWVGLRNGEEPSMS
jgi:hypothetical protein